MILMLNNAAYCLQIYVHIANEYGDGASAKQYSVACSCIVSIHFNKLNLFLSENEVPLISTEKVIKDKNVTFCSWLMFCRFNTKSQKLVPRGYFGPPKPPEAISYKTITNPHH